MNKIFISYRREDAADVTGRIYDRLREHFGEEEIFKDVDKIPFGVDFRHYIDEQVGQCRVFLAIISRNWLSLKNDKGKLRLEDSTDFLRIEIESALRRNILVIPLLVHYSKMPRIDELPESLQNISFRNGIPIRPDPDFHKDMDRLIRGLEQQLKEYEESAKHKFEEEANRKVVEDKKRKVEEKRERRQAEEQQHRETEVKAGQGRSKHGWLWGTAIGILVGFISLLLPGDASISDIGWVVLPAVGGSIAAAIAGKRASVLITSLSGAVFGALLTFAFFYFSSPRYPAMDYASFLVDCAIHGLMFGAPVGAVLGSIIANHLIRIYGSSKGGPS